MRPFSRWWQRWSGAALALLLCSAAWADPPGRVGRLAELQGTVWLYDTEQGEWVAAVRNRPVTSGDRLATDRDARAEVRIGSATLRLDANTQLDVTELDDDHIRVQLHQGSLALGLRNGEIADELEVVTADGRFLPRRAGHYRIDREAHFSAATVWSGAMRFDGQDSELEVAAGQRAEFWKESGVTHYTWGQPQRDGFGDWAQAEHRRDERLAHRHVSPEMTGWEDLDRHGHWERHPEYGVMWIPVRVAPGWAPYRHGHWTWVRPWGWTWVDDAPWGFAPFHYGRWTWWGGRWCWVPGSYVSRPVYAPALVGWVGGPSVNVNIHIGSGPVIGWVPLAPRDVYRPWYPLRPHHWRHVNPHVPDRFYRPGEPPHGPVMYTNRGVPGGVTVVPADVLRQRQPIANVVHKVDPRVAQQLVQQPAVQAPPPPSGIAVARPGPALPRTAPPVTPSPPTMAVPARPGSPAAEEGRRGHGAIVPPARRDPHSPAAQEMPPRRGQPPQQHAEPARAAPAVPAPPETRRIAPVAPPPPTAVARPAPAVVTPPAPVVAAPRAPEVRPVPSPQPVMQGGGHEQRRRAPDEAREAHHGRVTGAARQQVQ